MLDTGISDFLISITYLKNSHCVVLSCIFKAILSVKLAVLDCTQKRAGLEAPSLKELCCY